LKKLQKSDFFETEVGSFVGNDRGWETEIDRERGRWAQGSKDRKDRQKRKEENRDREKEKGKDRDREKRKDRG
jgi:U1 small nuclear ribonucleoprotein